MEFEELFLQLSKSVGDFEVSRFEGDIFFFNELVFREAALKNGYKTIILYQKTDPYGYWMLFDLNNLEEKSRPLFFKYLKNQNGFRKSFESKSKKVLASFKKLAMSEEFDTKKYVDLVKSMREFSDIAVCTLEGLERILGKELVSAVPDDDLRSKLLVSGYRSYVQSEEDALMNLIESASKKERTFLESKLFDLSKMPSLKKKIELHAKKWGWAYSNYASNSFASPEVVLKKVFVLYSGFESEKKRRIELNERVLEKKELVRKLNPSQRMLVGLSDLVSELRDKRKATWMKITPPVRGFLWNYANKLGSAFEDIKWLTVDEQIDFTKNKDKYELEIEKRKCGAVALYGFGYSSLIVGQEANRIEDLFLNQNKSNLLNGVVASVGKISGKAQVILSREDFSKFKQGMILVASHTTPDYLPLMKLSSAILTERGGITSHAAIVSRELKVPCIVGIKGLIRNVKSGDLVEVDANKGIVKITKESAK